MTTSIQQAAEAYLAVEWQPIRIKPRGKKPIGKAWQNSKPVVADFESGENIGVVMGAPSRGLVDIDLDAKEAREIASLPELFGQCPSFGREEHQYPGHYLLYCHDAGDNAKRHMFSPDGDFIDVRAGGCFTVFPPSEHAAKIVWSGGEMPVEIPSMSWEDLRQRARLVAFLSTCLKFYPGAGEHDSYVMAVAGVLAKMDVEPELGEPLIRGLCTFAADTHEITSRTAKARTSWNRVQAGKAVVGQEYLADIFGEKFTKTLRKYLKTEEEIAPVGVDAVWVEDPNTSRYTDAVAERIMALDPHLLFKRTSDLVRVRTVDTLEQDNTIRVYPGTVELVPVEESWLDYKVTKMGMEFFGYDAKGKRKPRQPRKLRKRIIEVVDALPFHPVVGISTTPILSCGEPGYDPESRLYLAFPAGMFPVVDLNSSKTDAEAALRRIMHPFRLFPFVDDASKSVIASAMISGVIRGTMATCPIHGVTCPVAGTGKTKTTQMVSIVMTGQIQTNLVEYTADEDEFAKRLGALFLRGVTSLVIDNINVPLSGSLFNMLLTAPVVSLRILGKSEAPPVSTRALIMANGNNLTATGDIVRRIVTCTMDADVERPDKRDFDFDPVEEVMRNRPQMVVDCLTILRAYIGAGRPCDPVHLGSFEDWTLVRGALLWLDKADPVDTQDETFADDTTTQDRRGVLAALYESRKDRFFTVADLDKIIDQSPVRKALAAAMPSDWSVRGAGKLLSKYAGHWAGDMVLRRGGILHGSSTWKVEKRTEKEAQYAMLVPEKDAYGYPIAPGKEGQE